MHINTPPVPCIKSDTWAGIQALIWHFAGTILHGSAAKVSKDVISCHPVSWYKRPLDLTALSIETGAFPSFAA